MTDSEEGGRFFLPGPTEVRPEVLAAMMHPMIPHRGTHFEQLFARVQDGLRMVFRTSRPVFVSTSSATGLMEASVRCAPAGPILSLVNGAFSARYAQIASASGRAVDVLEVPWGEVPSLEAVEERTSARQYAAVTVVHSETSTGALTDVRAVAELAHRSGALCLVDSVSGVGGAPLDADAWELDFVLTGSQKALALPPGLAFGVASAAYMHHAAEAPARGVYFDLVEFERYARKHQTPNTPAIPLLFALEAQLAAIAAEGMEHRWARHAAMARATTDWVREHAERYGPSLGVLAPPASRSPTVSAIVLPDGIAGPHVVAAMAERGYVIGSGYGKLREHTVRIGHMGDHTVDEVTRLLYALREALQAVREERNR